MYNDDDGFKAMVIIECILVLLILSFVMTSCLRNNSKNISISKTVLIQNKLAHYDKLNGEFILDIKIKKEDE